MNDDYKVSDELRDKLDEENARFVLSRADLLVNSTLEQLRKSTDRVYTLFGLLITAFSGLIAFVLSTNSIYLLIPSVILCLGLGSALYILFVDAIWVHSYRDAGNSPENLLVEKNMSYLYRKHKNNKAIANKEHLLNIIYDSIEDAAYAIRVNDKQLEERTKTILKIMKILKATIVIAAFVALVSMLCKGFVGICHSYLSSFCCNPLLFRLFLFFFHC